MVCDHYADQAQAAAQAQAQAATKAAAAAKAKEDAARAAEVSGCMIRWCAGGCRWSQAS